MRKMNNVALVAVIISMALFALVAPRSARAQNPWIDSIPQLQVGCLHGKSTPGSIDFNSLLMNAKSAGATAAGTPFLTKIDRSNDVTTLVSWEACVFYTGAAQSSDGFETSTFSPTNAAFYWCHEPDVATCGAGLLSWLKKKIPDFITPLRVQPLCGLPEKSLTEIKGSLPDVISIASPISSGSSASAFPPAKDELDKQLYGLSKDARPLLSVPGPPASAKADAGDVCTAVLIVAPIDNAQKATLEAP